MATIADLNVRIGSNIKGLESGLKKAEAELRKSGDTLGGIASKLSSTLSLAFGAIGGGALKSFGEIEKLQKGLEAQLGSAEAARAEMEKIREAAKAPGLGFEQFVKGSLQLEAVGDSADKARKTISVFGNALALAGKGAGELDGVVTALTQIKSKGVVSAEEINQIAERLPQIRPAMQDAFGTSSTEAIQKLGITATEFVDGITASLAKLPKASSSFSNDVTNAFDNIKQGAAKLGESINTNLRVGERLTALSEWAISASDYFQNLDENTQRWVVGIGVVAVAIGPAIKAGSAMVQVGGAIGNAWTKMTIIAQQWAVAAANPEAKTGLINWWKGLNTVMKANIIGITIGVVLALGAAFLLLSRDMSDAAMAQRSVNEVQRKASESIAGQKSEVDTLVAAYNKEGATLEDKKRILGELNRISPEYFGKLRAGKGDVDALSAATAAYGTELLRVAKITAAKERLVEIEKAMLNLNKTADPTIIQTVGNAILSFGNTLGAAGRQVASFQKNFNEQKNTLEAERDALTNLVITQEKAAGSMKRLGDGTGELSAKGKALKEVLSDIANAPDAAKLIGDDQDIAKIKALEKGITKLIDVGFKPASKEIQNLKAQLDALTKQPEPVVIDLIQKPDSSFNGIGQLSQQPTQALPAAPNFAEGVTVGISDAAKALQIYADNAAYAAEIQQQLNDKTFNFQNGLSDVSKAMIEQGNIMGGVFSAMGDAIAQAASSGETSLAKLGQAAAGAAAKIIRAYIQQGVAAAVAKALSSLPFPINIAAGAAAGGLAAALFTKAIGSIGIKGFANGTNDAPGGLAIVGERGKELVNMPRHSKVIPNPQTNRILNNMGGGGGNMNISGEFTVRGTDLVLVLDRANRKNQRQR